MPDWRNPWPPIVWMWRPEQIADASTWRTHGRGDDQAGHAVAKVERNAGASQTTMVNPLDPVASGLRETPPGAERRHGLHPIPAGRGH